MSPTVMRSGPYRIMIFVNDHLPEHVHVFSGGKRAKINLNPIEVVDARGFSPHELRRAVAVIVDNRDKLLETWRRIHPAE